MRFTYLGAAAAIALALAGCGDRYGDDSSNTGRGNPGATRPSPSTFGPPMTAAPAMGPGQNSDIGANPSQGAPTGGP